MKRLKRIILASSVTIGIVAPVFASAAEAAPTASTNSGTTTSDTTITVRSGDSLVGIAQRHGVRLSVLLRANSLTPASVIHPGDTLVIPAGATLPSDAAAGGAAASAPSSITTPVTSGAGTTYVVRPGDALAGIAWRHGVRLGSLVQANGITVTSLILPGQRLEIPPATMPVPAARAATPATASSSVGAAPSTPASAPAAATATSGSLQTLLGYLTAQVGAPYRFFSAGPDAFDCSGLVVAGFREIGITLPHQSRALARGGSSVDWTTESIAAGDLVFTSATGDPDFITHVGVALDSHRWVHAVGFGQTVSIGTLPASNKIMAVQRIALP